MMMASGKFHNSPADQSLAKNMSKNWELKDDKKSMTTCSSGKFGIWRNEFFHRWDGGVDINANFAFKYLYR